MKEKKKLDIWRCPLCRVNYGAQGEELMTTCIWVHIFRKDKYYKLLQRDNPTL